MVKTVCHMTVSGITLFVIYVLLFLFKTREHIQFISGFQYMFKLALCLYIKRAKQIKNLVSHPRHIEKMIQ